MSALTRARFADRKDILGDLPQELQDNILGRLGPRTLVRLLTISHSSLSLHTHTHTHTHTTPPMPQSQTALCHYTHTHTHTHHTACMTPRHATTFHHTGLSMCTTDLRTRAMFDLEQLPLYKWLVFSAANRHVILPPSCISLQ